MTESTANMVACISARIKVAREAHGLTLQDLADRSGLSKSHVYDLERGKQRNPSIAATWAIARALGLSLDYLTGLSIGRPALHPEAERIACEIDYLLRFSCATTEPTT